MSKSSKGTTATALVEHTITSGESMEPKIIKVSPDTHKKLLKLGAKGETFDDVIQRLIKEHEEGHKEK